MSEEAPARRYPVLVRGRLEEPLSRWLWLVKWLLLVPHYIVLAFLWIAFVAVTVVAFFAVLVSGRYPAGLFAFNLGVLRWSWRVAYYGYSALGTDRYPPFTLAEVPDYPATLDIAYPDRLSRGLVLVKWWLLALPQYLILGFLAGGATWTVNTSTGGTQTVWTTASTSLVTLLALFAGVALLFGLRYPRGLYDLLIGLDRWVLRVVAYAALMTDAYPPFRLDQGGDEPGGPEGPAPSAPAGAALQPPVYGAPVPAQPAGGPAPARRSTAGPIVALVIGLLVLLPGLGLAAAGGAGLWLGAQRDAAGFATTPTRLLTTPTAAITAEDVDLSLDRATSTWLSEQRYGTVRVRATAPDGTPLFVGVAPQSAVNGWLGPVAHDQVSDLARGSVTYTRHAGRPDAGSPASQTFWAASRTGTGTVEVQWPIQDGNWAFVVLRADGTPGVQARVDVGASIPSLTGISVGLLVSGLLLLALGIVLIAVGAARIGRASGPVDGGGGRPSPTPPGPRAAPVAESGDVAGSSGR
jgi:hypothetical protein